MFGITAHASRRALHFATRLDLSSRDDYLLIADGPVTIIRLVVVTLSRMLETVANLGPDGLRGVVQVHRVVDLREDSSTIFADDHVIIVDQ
jgi:hypothetical protein